MMKSMWEMKPKRRPTFKEIANQINAMFQQEPADQMYYDTGRN